MKATTAHEHYVVQPWSGPQPALVPSRQRKGRDAAASWTSAWAQRQQAWAVQRETAVEVVAGPFADGGGGVSSGSSVPVTPANLGAKRSRWSEAALRHASTDCTVESCTRRVRVLDSARLYPIGYFKSPGRVRAGTRARTYGSSILVHTAPTSTSTSIINLVRARYSQRVVVGGSEDGGSCSW